MSEFSEYLDGYMEEKLMNSAELSRETDIERTLIYRYRKGSRVPSDEGIVMRMADALRMNVSEKNVLMEKYDRITMGELTVNSYQYVRNLLRKLKNTNKDAISEQNSWQMLRTNRSSQQIIQIQTKEEIVSCISNLFADAVKQEVATVYLMMQPVYEDIQKLILSFFRNTNIRIEQIVCLEQSLPQSYKNLEIIRQVIPLCFEQIRYEVMYYYDFLTYHINTMSWMPNVLLVGDSVIQFDYNMEQGIVVKDDVYRKSMMEEFLRIKWESQPFLVQGTDMTNAMKFYEGVRVMQNGGTLFRQPCFGLCISTDIYEKFLVQLPQRDELIKGMALINGDWNGMTFIPPADFKKGAIKSYCQESGIRAFMESGRVHEFPPDFYEPLDYDARKRILERMIWLLETEFMDCYFLPEEIEIPESIHFYWSEEKKRLSLNQVGLGSISQVLVEEQGIYRAFQCFFEYLEKKGKLISREEMLERLDKIRREYW